jgi:hypothetical protein
MMLIHIIMYPQRGRRKRIRNGTAQGNSTLNLNNFDDLLPQLDLVNIAKLGSGLEVF